MYRVKALRKHDSGWCFMCGLESQAYLDDPKNLDIYDVNTIANYDPEIIPLLDALPGSAFARSGEGGPLLPAEFPGADE